MRRTRMHTRDGKPEEAAVAREQDRSLTGAEVSAEEARIVLTRGDYCKETITQGRFAGRKCGNVIPCEEPDVKPLADFYQSTGPDQYPRGFYEKAARDAIAEQGESFRRPVHPFIPKRPRPGELLW